MERRELFTTLFLFFNAVVGVFTLLAGDKLYSFLPQVGMSGGIGTAWMVCASASVLFTFALLFWYLLSKPKQAAPPVPSNPGVPDAPVPLKKRESEAPVHNTIAEDLAKHKDSFEWKMNEAARHVPTPRPSPPPQARPTIPASQPQRRPIPPVAPPDLTSQTNLNYDKDRSEQRQQPMQPVVQEHVVEIPVEVEEPQPAFTVEELSQISFDEEERPAPPPPEPPKQRLKPLDYADDDNPYR